MDGFQEEETWKLSKTKWKTKEMCVKGWRREREQSVRCSMCQEFKEAEEKQQKDEAGLACKGSKEGLAKNPDLILKAVEVLMGFKQRNDTTN